MKKEPGLMLKGLADKEISYDQPVEMNGAVSSCCMDETQ